MDNTKFARRFYSNLLPSGNAKLGDFSIFNNDLYFYNGSQWLLIANSGSTFPLGGDLSGTTDNATVVGIQGLPISNTAPLNGQSLVFNGIDYSPTYVSVPTYAPYLVFVSSLADLPAPIAGVITLQAGYTYFFITQVDLLGNRLTCGANTTILGASPENCRIFSTGLIGQPLISSNFSLSIRDITLEADTTINLDASGNPNQTLEWFGVKFTNCNVIGTINDYRNISFQSCNFVNSGNITLDGNMNTINIFNSSFDIPALYTGFIIPNTFICGSVLEFTDSSFIVGVGGTGISISNLSGSFAIKETFILDSIRFSGLGTYLSGVIYTDEEALITSCVGVLNSTPVAEYYMIANAVGTPAPVQGDFYKVLGITSSFFVNRFDVSVSNRATYTGPYPGLFKVSASLNATDGNNRLLSFGIAINGVIYPPSEVRSLTGNNNRAESIYCQAIVQLNSGQYVEVFAANLSVAGSTVTVTELSLIIERLN